MCAFEREHEAVLFARVCVCAGRIVGGVSEVVVVGPISPSGWAMHDLRWCVCVCVYFLYNIFDFVVAPFRLKQFEF